MPVPVVVGALVALILVVIYAVTVIGWMRARVAEGGWAWLDVVVLGQRPVVVWERINVILVSLVYAMLICLMARLLGIGIVNQNAIGSDLAAETSQRANSRTMPLRDLLLLVACIAVLFAALTPLRSTVRQVGYAEWLQWRTIKGVSVIMLLSAATMASTRRLFIPGCVFALGMFAVLMTYEFSRFITVSELGWPWNYNLLSLSITLSSSVVAISVFLMPYRLRSWRIERTRYANKSLTT